MMILNSMAGQIEPPALIRKFTLLLAVTMLLVLGYIRVQAQGIRVELSAVATADPPGGHLSILNPTIPTDVSLPEIHSGIPYFFSLDRPLVLIREKDHDQVFVDHNNNRDFRDDGPPINFPHTSNSLQISAPPLKSEDDSVVLRLERKPVLPDSLLARTMDSRGNLLPRFAHLWATVLNHPEFKGEAGTYLFSDILGMRTGTVEVDGHQFSVGLLRSHSGSFADRQNSFVVDRNGDKVFNPYRGAEVIGLQNVFSIGKKVFQVGRIGTRGTWIELQEVKREAPLTGEYTSISAMEFEGSEERVSPDLWNRRFKTLVGTEISMLELRGKNILLNFWGEWCMPCLQEIPDLVDLHDQMSADSIVIISFLHSERPELAMRMARSKKMNWDHVLLTDSLATYFGIWGYPTNILVMRNGRDAQRLNQVNLRSFRSLAR